MCEIGSHSPAGNPDLNSGKSNANARNKMALKLIKSGINLDTKETEEKENKPPFVSVELTKRGYQTITIT